ncbi:MAG: hypothetical protein WA634_06090 [Silvibacterium sp.]
MSGTLAIARQSAAPKDHQSNVILGVLEDVAGEYAGQSDTRKLRAVFQKTSNEWRPFPTRTRTYLDLKTLPHSYPQQMTWTIAFHGRKLGTVTAHTPAQFDSYSEIGTELINSRGPVPTIGKKSVDYGGFPGYSVYRPLVAVSRPNVADPDNWHRVQPSQGQIEIARNRFRARFPKVSNCRNADENIGRPWHYRDRDIHVIAAYTSRQHWLLLDLSLTGYACDGPTDEPFLDQWFVVRPSGEVSFIGQEMWLVDAGDYDKSGQSELLFSISGMDIGGYRLFYRNFTRSAEFIFYYH